MHPPPGLGVVPQHHPEVRIRLGRKGDRGGVVGRDRFWITTWRADGSGQQAVSNLAPGFEAFNANVAENDESNLSKRRILRGCLVHANFYSPERFGNGAMTTQFKAQQLPGMAAPAFGGPTCSSKDGVTAKRWNQRADSYEEIHCPAEACPFRQEISSNSRTGKTYVNVPCHRTSAIVFQLRWISAAGDAFPCSRAWIEARGSWGSATHQWWAFHESIVNEYRQLGGTGELSWYGFPIKLVLEKRTSPVKRSSYWVPCLYPDFPPGMTLQSWLLKQAEMSSALLLEGPTVGAAEIVDAEAIAERASLPGRG